MVQPKSIIAKVYIDGKHDTRAKNLRLLLDFNFTVLIERKKQNRTKIQFTFNR